MNPDKPWDFQTFIQTFKELTISNFNGNDHLKNLLNSLSPDRQKDE